ncbi:hypothetical protein FUAX_53170 (plasmid) [Fulvitalea axinellae]|uniref:Peptidase S74 domain-containing protein n=1 Tax=Fulvitalea axinellae TaxID=1182444 RepID=A0AAU9DK36_9BACT|nr:hypothetical protein FUAX_53170 [Fulvitalea axinellae]
MKKTLLLLLALLPVAGVMAQDHPNVKIGLDSPADGVRILTNWPGYTGGWARGFSIGKGTGTETLISFGGLGQVTNGQNTDFQYGYIGRSYDQTYMVFRPNGDVGIGTLEPDAMLEIKGHGWAGNDVGSGLLRLRATDGFASMSWYQKDDAEATWSLYTGGNGSWVGENNIGFVSHTGPLSTGRVKLMIEESSGNVGIGTVKPMAKLQVHTNGTARAFRIKNDTNGAQFNFWTTETGGQKQLRIDEDTQGKNVMILSQNGNVGIGTEAIPEKLSVNGNISLTGDLKMNGTDSYIWTNGSGTGYTGIWDAKNGRPLLHASETKGNIGIGTIDPKAKLHLVGQGPMTPHGGALIIGPIISNHANLRLGYTNTYSWIQAHGNRPLFINSLGNNTILNKDGGFVGIGTDDPQGYHLAVKGKIRAQEVKVSLEGWSDFVFEDGYVLPSLADVEEHIRAKGHLEHIPSAKEVEMAGIDLGAMNAKLLRKIEELTLYAIEQEKRLVTQNTTIDNLKRETEKVSKLEMENQALKKSNATLTERVERIESLLKSIGNLRVTDNKAGSCIKE